MGRPRSKTTDKACPASPCIKGWELPADILIGRLFSENEKIVLESYMRGVRGAHIAKENGWTPSYVSKIINSPKFANEVIKQCAVIRGEVEAKTSEAIFYSPALDDRQNRIVASKARGLSDEEIATRLELPIEVVQKELLNEKVKGQLDIIYRQRAENRKTYKYQDMLGDLVNQIHEDIKNDRVDNKTKVELLKALGKFTGDDAGTAKTMIIAQNIQINKGAGTLPNGGKAKW